VAEVAEVAQGEWPAAKGKVCRIRIIWRHEFYNQRRSCKIITLRRYMNCAPHHPLSHLSHFAEGVPLQPPFFPRCPTAYDILIYIYIM
jgi:hypothetical protein